MLRRGRVEDRNQIVAIRFNDFDCTQNTLDAETDRPVYKLNYSVAMNAYDDDQPLWGLFSDSNTQRCQG